MRVQIFSCLLHIIFFWKSECVCYLVIFLNPKVKCHIFRAWRFASNEVLEIWTGKEWWTPSAPRAPPPPGCLPSPTTPGCLSCQRGPKPVLLLRSATLYCTGDELNWHTKNPIIVWKITVMHFHLELCNEICNFNSWLRLYFRSYTLLVAKKIM